MVRIEKLELTAAVARYKYFPEKSNKSGIVGLNRHTGERMIEKPADGFGSNYAAHALRRIEEFEREGEFPEEDTVVWY